MFRLPPSDECLDQQLRDVPLPEGLMDRLRQTASPSDAELNRQLADVPVPPGLELRLQRLTAPRRVRAGQRLALAASLLLAVGLTYSGAVVTYVRVGLHSSNSPAPQWLDSFLPGDVMELRATVRGNPAAGLEDSYLLEEPTFAGQLTPEIQFAAVAPPPRIPVFPSPLPFVEHFDPARHVELNLEQFGAGVLAAGPTELELPEWKLLPGLVPRGVEPPRSPAFNLSFLHATRFHPVVRPALDRELATSRVPLSISRESYLLAKRFIEQGELPPAGIIRTEEFLAAVDYQLPPPKRDRLALHTSGGVSVFNRTPLQLLHVGVRAADIEPARRGPAHLIVCIDASASMRRGARLEMARTALVEWRDRMLPEDRISLLAVGSKPRVLLEQAGPQDTSHWEAALDALVTEPRSNPVDALRLAYGLAAEASTQKQWTQHVVLLSDGLIEVDSLATMPLEAYLRASAGRWARLWLLDLSQNQTVPDHWRRLAQAAKGGLRQAATSEEIRWALLEAVSGTSQQVATDVSLSVWFNPQAVAGYRLFGHEATLLTAPLRSSMHSGQTSVALYELQLLPKGADHVATVTLTWRDAQTGQRRSSSQRLTRSSFSKTFSRQAPSLQLATLAAETAELLRRSPYREGVTWGNLYDLAASLSGPARDNASFEELTWLMRQAERARPASAQHKQMWGGTSP